MQRTAGNRLLHIVVEDNKVGQRCIDELLKVKAGRLTFLPLNRLKPRVVHLPDGEKNAHAMTKVARVKGEKEHPELKAKFMPALETVWGTSFIAKDADNAARIAKAHDVECCLTSGDKVRFLLLYISPCVPMFICVFLTRHAKVVKHN